jgi:hypothetical protein
VILHVNDDALPGGNGSAAAPFRTIQEAVNQAGPGTQVLVADGIYREAVTFPASGTAGKWIQVKAAGDAAILDSADRLTREYLDSNLDGKSLVHQDQWTCHLSGARWKPFLPVR